MASFQRLSVILTLLLVWGARAPSPSRAAGQSAEACNQAASEPVLTVDLPGRVFKAIPSRDGCWIFASLQGREPAQPGIALLRREGGRVSLERVIPLGSPSALVQTHDGSLLIVANGDFVEFLGVDRILSGFGEVRLGRLTGGPDSREAFVNVTADDRFLFVSDHGYESVTVYDLEAARQSGFRADPRIGAIPVGRASLSTIFSPDGRTGYSISEFAPSEAGWPRTCRNDPEGVLITFDVERATTDPSTSVISMATSGCVPVRLALSADGAAAYVTSRSGNEVHVFDTTRLRAGAGNARVAVIPVGNAPVGLTLIDRDSRLLVTSSRAAESDPSQIRYLSVLDTSKIHLGAGATVGRIPAGDSPHEVVLTEDGRTLVLSQGNSVSLFDMGRLPVQPMR